jgi:hypothetical protein
MTPTSVPGGTRLAVRLHWQLRAVSGLGASAALAYAAALGWQPHASGVATAAAFAVGFLFATFALSGTVPANIKVGDVEIKLDQARADGEQTGHVAGFTAGTAISRQVAAGDLPVDRIEAALRSALTGPGPLKIDGIQLPVAQLSPAEAEDAVLWVREALSTVAKHSAR